MYTLYSDQKHVISVAKHRPGIKVSRDRRPLFTQNEQFQSLALESYVQLFQFAQGILATNKPE